MPTSTKLPKSWPPVARDILLDAARYYYRQMKEPWPVSDVAMNNAIEWANNEIATRQGEIYEGASSRWINRWESGKLNAEMRRAIEETYRRLSRAEGAIRPRAGARKTPRAGARKKTPRQLEAEIHQALSSRPERMRSGKVR